MDKIKEFLSIDRLYLYYFISLSLLCWTVLSFSHIPVMFILGYVVSVLLLLAFLMFIWGFKYGNFRQNRLRYRRIVGIMVIFMNFGLSIMYRKWQEMQKSTFWESFWDVLFFLAAFFLMFLIAYFLLPVIKRQWRMNSAFPWQRMVVGIFAMIPVVTLFGARLFGHRVGGSYLSFMGIMVFPAALSVFPFVVAYCASIGETEFVRGNARGLSMPLSLLLGYTVVLMMGAALCNEFGLLMIIGLTVLVIFFVRCVGVLSKTIATTVCVVGGLFCALFIPHIAYRVSVWLNPAGAVNQQGAETVLYLFRNIYHVGWWGSGMGSLPKEYYTTWASDHAFVTLIHDYSPLVAGLILMLGALLFKWMLTVPDGLDAFDRYLNMSAALIIGIMMLVDVASCLGSFIVAGIGFPWISEGSQINMMLSGFIGIHCGIVSRGG